jgi:RNA recognition motif-containing protein
MTTIYIGNFSEEIKEENLFEIFSTFGPIKSVEIVKDSKQKKKNYGYIIFSLKEDAKEAIFNMDGAEFFGKVLKVQYSTKQIAPSDKPIWDLEEYQHKYLNVENANDSQINNENKSSKFSD